MKKPAISFLLLATVCLATPHLFADDWPNWRGPHRDGKSLESVLASWPAKGPKVLWQADLTGGYSSVAVADGRLFTQAKVKAEETILCFDAVNGKKLWEFRYPCDYEDYKATLDQRFKSGPRATPAVDGSRVYTIGAAGDLFCLDVRTGKKIWHKSLLKMADRKLPEYGYCNSPFILGDRLFVHPGGQKGCSLAALDKHDGRILWQALDYKIGWATPVQYDFQGKPQLVYFPAFGPVAVTPADGKLLWQHEWKTDFDLNVAAPIYDGGRLFISSNYGKGGALLRLNPHANPDVVWQNQSMANHFSCSILYQGHLYGFSNARLRSVDFATGKVNWDKEGLGRGALLIAGGHVIALGEQGTLVVAEASPKAYVEKSRWQALNGRCWSAPVLANGVLYLRHESKLVAVKAGNSR
jgi:outer membrane protein assembly factor BamB